MSVRLLNLGSLVMAIGAIGGLGIGIAGGSSFSLIVAMFCALNLALLQGLAFSHQVGRRLDTIIDEVRPTPRAANDDVGGQ